MSDPLEVAKEGDTMTRFLRQHAARIVIGAVLAAAGYGVLIFWVPYQREQRIARTINTLGGRVGVEYRGPTWIPRYVQATVPFAGRIESVLIHGCSVPVTLTSEFRMLTHLKSLDLSWTKSTDAGMEHVGALTHLEMLALKRSEVTDSGLLHLKDLTKLEWLILTDTRVTDSGLEHFKHLTSLEVLDLEGTQISDSGMKQLSHSSRLRRLFLTNSAVTDLGLKHLLSDSVEVEAR